MPPPAAPYVAERRLALDVEVERIQLRGRRVLTRVEQLAALVEEVAHVEIIVVRERATPVPAPWPGSRVSRSLPVYQTTAS